MAHHFACTCKHQTLDLSVESPTHQPLGNHPITSKRKKIHVDGKAKGTNDKGSDIYTFHNVMIVTSEPYFVVASTKIMVEVQLANKQMKMQRSPHFYERIRGLMFSGP